MINFNQIPILNVDVSIPLLFEDRAVPPVVDISGYQGPRTRAEIAEMAVRAIDIVELRGVALAIGWGDVEIIRSSVASGVISPDTHPCLDENSSWLMSIKDPGDAGADYGQHLESLFILQIANYLDGRTLWTRGATYFALGLQAQTALIVPDIFCSSADFAASVDALDGHVGDWTGLGVSITPSDALAFVQTLAKYHPSAEAIGGAILMVSGWLHHLNGAITSGKGLLAEFEALRPDLGFVLKSRFNRSPRVLPA